MNKILISLIAAAAIAAARGTPDEAKALAEKAVAHVKKVGHAQALADFNAGRSPWTDRDLYVFCVDAASKELANGAFQSLVGTSANTVKDVHDKGVGAAAWEAVSKTGSGSVEYEWINPVTRRTEPKISFVQKVDADLLCGVGAYNPR